jgi:hypothetical protein
MGRWGDGVMGSSEFGVSPSETLRERSSEFGIQTLFLTQHSTLPKLLNSCILFLISLQFLSFGEIFPINSPLFPQRNSTFPQIINSFPQGLTIRSGLKGLAGDFAEIAIAIPILPLNVNIYKEKSV